MYGDSAAMRKRVQDLQEQARDLRALADGLVGHIDTLRWEGRAARDLRDRVTDRAAGLRTNADQQEVAADALNRHLNEVERRKDTIADLERRTLSLTADARDRVARIDSSDPLVQASDDDRRLLAFTPPPSGHKEWLTVTIPGL